MSVTLGTSPLAYINARILPVFNPVLSSIQKHTPTPSKNSKIESLPATTPPLFKTTIFS